MQSSRLLIGGGAFTRPSGASRYQVNGCGLGEQTQISILVADRGNKGIVPNKRLTPCLTGLQCSSFLDGGLQLVRNEKCRVLIIWVLLHPLHSDKSEDVEMKLAKLLTEGECVHPYLQGHYFGRQFCLV